MPLLLQFAAAVHLLAKSVGISFFQKQQGPQPLYPPRGGGDEFIGAFGTSLQYFLKKYLTGVTVTMEKIDEAESELPLRRCRWFYG